MPDGVRFRIEGHEEIQRQLLGLGASLGTKVLKQTVRAAARPVIRNARRRVGSERIAREIKTIRVVADPDGTVNGEVGIPGGRSEAAHGLWKEFGTGPRIQKKTGRRTGSMPADPFLRPAAEEETPAVVATFEVEVRKRIRKYGGS